MSNLIVGLNSIFELARKISSLEDKSIEIMQVKWKEKGININKIPLEKFGKDKAHQDACDRSTRKRKERGKVELFF